MRLTNHLVASICAIAALAAAPAFSEEPAAKQTSAAPSATTPVSATTAPVGALTATPTPPLPPPVDRKKALEFGFRPGVVNGIPVFCKEVPIEGTRFTNKRCVREKELAAYLSQLQIAREAAIKSGCYGTGICTESPLRPRMSMGSK